MSATSNGGLAGQVAVVSGAGQGLGRALALGFAGAGATVVLVARSAEKLDGVAAEIAAAGGSALAVPADVRDEASVEALRERVAAEAGPVDILINNSGVPGPTAPLWEQTRADWDDTFAVNVTGVYLMCRAFVPAMVERASGSVIVIGSMTGKRALHGRTPYAASKTALIGLVRTLAWELGGAGVRVNLVSPGPIAGPRLDAVIAGQALALGRGEDEVRRDLAAVSPLGRFVDAQEIAAAALFLASDAASSITGEDLNVSAGAVSYG
jgi:NAD(P)-dependent dehydrogenase (short-subunit alcohol dehydrogenase family)